MALCAVAGRHNAAYFTHIRDESNKVLEAVEEAIDIARAFRIHVEIVHLKCSGVDNWGKAGADPGAHRRQRGPRAATSIATPIPMPPAPIR